MNSLLTKILDQTKMAEKTAEGEAAGAEKTAEGTEKTVEAGAEKTAEKTVETEKTAGAEEKAEDKTSLLGKEKTEVKVEPITAEALEIPEGLEVADEVRDQFLDLMNNAEISPAERANKLLSLQADAMKAASEKNSALWQDTQDEWQKATKELPEIGGDKLPETLAGIKKLVDTYGSPELYDVFDLTGAGNNPEVVKFLAKIAKDLSEGEPLSGKPTDAPRDLADVLYPNQGKQ